MTKKLREVIDEREVLEIQYNTYSSDILKMIIYVRGFLDNEYIQQYVAEKHPDIYQKVLEILDRE